MARQSSLAQSSDWDTNHYVTDQRAYDPPAYQTKTLSDSQTVELLPRGDQQYANRTTTGDENPFESANMVLKLLCSWWLWEILGAFVSMTAITAIIAILAVHDGGPLSEWNFPITLNSLISLFATVAKAALLLPVGQVLGQLKWIWFHQRARRLDHLQTFDDASRGPWGALQLLYSTRGKARLAAWGAMITLAALAIDPFAQQVITYEGRRVASGSSGVARCQNWTTNDSVITSQRIVQAIDLGFQAKAAIYNGFFGSNTSMSVPTDCPSGNCTWPLFTSLGMCSTCADVTLQTTRSCQARLIHSPSASDPNWKYAELNCTYALPYSTYLNATFLWADDYSEWASTSYTNIASTGNWVGLIPETPDLRVVGMSRIRFNNSNETMSSWVRVEGVPIPPVKVTQCLFYFCIQLFNVSVSNGEISSFVTDTSPNLNTANLTVTTDHGYQGYPYNLSAPTNFTSNEVFADYPMDGYPSAVPSSTFVVNNWIFEALVMSLGSLFTHAPTNINLKADSGSPGLDIVELLYYRDDLSSVMANVATSFSTYLRSLPGPNNRALGTAWKMETFIHVRWAWLTLPILVVLMGVVFLLSAIIRTRRLAGWKSSILAVLFHGLGDHHKREARGLVEMEHTAKDIRVRLKQTREGGWGLVEA